MRVALISRYPDAPESPHGGVEAVTVILARALSELNGLEVHVLALERKCLEAEMDKDGRVTVHRLPASRLPQIADVFIGPGRRHLVRYLQRLQPDVVHVHETYGLGLGRLPIPCVFTVHGFDHANVVAEGRPFSGSRSVLWTWAEKYGLSRQRHIISITPYVRKMIEPLTRATIYDIENPIDGRFFQVQRREERGRILFVGWINDRKNPLGLVQALSKVLERGIEAHLLLAGQSKDHAYRGWLDACIEDLGVAEHVQLIGHIPHGALLDELARASIFVLPSRQENSPMAIAEAMAAGVPVISSNRCGMPYMIRDGETGLLVEPDDDEALAARIAMLLSNDSLREQMSRAAHQEATARWHPDTVARKTLEVYRSILGDAPKPSSGSQHMVPRPR